MATSGGRDPAAAAIMMIERQDMCAERGLLAGTAAPCARRRAPSAFPPDAALKLEFANGDQDGNFQTELH